MAAENNLPSICSVLLQNGVDFAAVDNRGNREDSHMTSSLGVTLHMTSAMRGYERGCETADFADTHVSTLSQGVQKILLTS